MSRYQCPVFPVSLLVIFFVVIVACAGVTTTEHDLASGSTFLVSSGPLPPSYETQPPDAITSEGLDSAWVIICTWFVFLMRFGFLWLEWGSIGMSDRQMNTHLLMKLMESGVTALAFALIGFGIAFAPFPGNTNNVFIGSVRGHLDLLFSQDNPLYLSFFFWEFNYNLAHNAATIVAGAVAPRIKPGAYLGFAFLMSAFIQPVVMHWCWSPYGLFTSKFPIDETGIWNTNGAVDLAGGMSVHMVGGIAALTASSFVGKPRTAVKKAQDTDLSNITLGAVILWLCWYGFNCGSTGGITGNKWLIITYISFTLTTTAGASLCYGFIYQLFIVRKKPRFAQDPNCLSITLREPDAQFNNNNQAFRGAVKTIGGAYMKYNVYKAQIDFVNTAIPIKFKELKEAITALSTLKNSLYDFDIVHSDLDVLNGNVKAIEEKMTQLGLSLENDHKEVKLELNAIQVNDVIFLNASAEDLAYYTHLLPQVRFDFRNRIRQKWDDVIIEGKLTLKQWAEHQRAHHWQEGPLFSLFWPGDFSLPPDRIRSIVEPLTFSVLRDPQENESAEAIRARQIAKENELKVAFDLNVPQVRYGELVNCLLAGMVSITAGGHVLPVWCCFIVSLLAVIFYSLFVLLEDWLGVTDRTRAFPVHFGGGIVGGVAAGLSACMGEDTNLRFLFFYNHPNLAADHCVDQLGVNLLYIILLTAWVWMTCALYFWILKRYNLLVEEEANFAIARGLPKAPIFEDIQRAHMVDLLKTLNDSNNHVDQPHVNQPRVDQRNVNQRNVDRNVNVDPEQLPLTGSRSSVHPEGYDTM